MRRCLSPLQSLFSSSPFLAQARSKLVAEDFSHICSQLRPSPSLIDPSSWLSSSSSSSSSRASCTGIRGPCYFDAALVPAASTPPALLRWQLLLVVQPTNQWWPNQQQAWQPLSTNQCRASSTPPQCSQSSRVHHHSFSTATRDAAASQQQRKPRKRRQATTADTAGAPTKKKPSRAAAAVSGVSQQPDTGLTAAAQPAATPAGTASTAVPLDAAPAAIPSAAKPAGKPSAAVPPRPPPAAAAQVQPPSSLSPPAGDTSPSADDTWLGDPSLSPDDWLLSPPSSQQQHHQQQAMGVGAGWEQEQGDCGGVEEAGMLQAREQELFERVLSDIPAVEAKGLLKAVHRFGLDAQAAVRGLEMALELHREFPTAMDLASLLKPRVLRMQDVLRRMEPRELQRLLPCMPLTVQLLLHEPDQVSRHITAMVKAYRSQLAAPLPAHYLKVSRLERLLRVPTSTAIQLLTQLRQEVGSREAAAALLQEFPELLFDYRRVQGALEVGDELCVLFGLNLYEVLRLVASHKSLFPGRLLRLKEWQGPLQQGLALTPQELQQVMRQLPMLLTYPNQQQLLSKFRMLQQLMPGAPKQQLLQLLAHSTVVRHPSATSLQESLTATAEVFQGQPVDLLPLLLKGRHYQDQLSLLQQQAAGSYGDVGGPNSRKEAAGACTDAEADVVFDGDSDAGLDAAETASAALRLDTDLPAAAAAAAAATSQAGRNFFNTSFLLVPAPDMRQRAEHLRQVFNTTPERLATILRRCPRLLAAAPLTVGMKITMLAGHIIGQHLDSKEAAQALAQLLSKCPQVLTLPMPSVVERIQTLKGDLGLSEAELRQVLRRQPRLLVMAQQRRQVAIQQLQQLLPEGQFKKLVLRQPELLEFIGRPSVAATHPRMQYLSQLSSTPPGDQLLAKCLASPAAGILLSLTQESLEQRLATLSRVTGQGEAELLDRILNPKCDFGRLIGYTPQRILQAAQLLSAMLALDQQQTTRLLSRRPVLLQLSSDTVFGKVALLGRELLQAAQQLAQQQDQQHEQQEDGQEPQQYLQEQKLGRQHQQHQQPQQHQQQQHPVELQVSEMEPLASQEVGEHAAPEPLPDGADLVPGLPLVSAAVLARPEMLLLDTGRLVGRLQLLLGAVEGQPAWAGELGRALHSGRLAHWLVMADARLTGRLHLLQQLPGTHHPAAAASSTWSIMHTLTMSEKEWSRWFPAQQG